MSEPSFHPESDTHVFVTVILPLAIPKPYTYHIPEEWVKAIKLGVRVEVKFGKNRLYTALVIDIHQHAPTEYTTNPILSVIDEEAIVHPLQIKLWEWMASYYCCTLGEVMNAALPANLKLASETQITLSPLFDEDFAGLDDKEYLIAEALTIQETLSIDEVQKILDQKTVYPLIRRLLEKRVIYLKEDLKEKYTPKKMACVKLTEAYANINDKLTEAFDLVARSEKQTSTLLAYIDLSKKQEFIRRQDLFNRVDTDSAVLKAMEKKGIFELYEREVSRLGTYEEELLEAHQLSDQQIKALTEIGKYFEEKKVVLLHGVTGSGKTRVYIEKIKETIKEGGQVLYLLPEIALTSQIIRRLQLIFGDQIVAYHSRLNNNERVELWKSVLAGKPIVLGARSALFLPFKQLDLIIVDEEHDPSFKQNEPSPRYSGRDTAIMLAHLHGANVLMGSATPSIESYYNVKKKKYGLVQLPERFGGIQMPEIVIVDAKVEFKKRKMQSHFTTQLIEELKGALERGEQAILFQNRRGYSPTYRCNTCGWHSECINCDVSLTYHKFFNTLKCHYCGYQSKLVKDCPACGSNDLGLQGFGTEKIEDDLKIYLPDAKIGRMDWDTVRGKDAHAKIINDFEERRLDILVGTQMVTKGLDFENVGVVGILSADQLMHFPDFRAGERAYQLMVQVSGRAGRKHKQGKVIIQAFNTTVPVLREVLHNDYFGFFQREMEERYQFQYPPFVRLIRITLKHKTPKVLNDAGRLLAVLLKKRLGEWVVGPAVPYVARVRNYYLLDFLVKLNKDKKNLLFAKESILDAIIQLHQTTGFSGVRVNIDVDPG
ncbi:MAG: primosomal protein N' [Saprospiraceae bacterium]